MLKEFKEFAMKGSVIDLAVGVVIGTAFQKIIDSLVNDIIMPLIAALLGQVDFSNLSFMINGTPIKYGSFITQVINFLIIAFSIFLAVRYVNKLNEKLSKVGENIAGKIDKDGKIAKKLGIEKEEKSVRVEDYKLNIPRRYQFTHQYSVSEHYEAIDFYYPRFYWNKLYRMIYVALLPKTLSNLFFKFLPTSYD